jgi:putative solute:sodium symporter small subunit
MGFSEREGRDVSTELPASEHAGRDRHQLRTLILAVAILSTVLLAVFLGVTTATWLNQYGFLHFPLGFYLLAQGLLIFIVVATFWFIRLQERIDQARSESEELG